MGVAYERIIIVGNLGGNPEVRTTKDGQQVANFSLAVNRKKGDKQTTTWYRIACWNGNADVAVKFLQKGSKVMIEGSGLRASAYFDQSGRPQASLELNADRIIFLDSAPEGNATNAEDTTEVPF